MPQHMQKIRAINLPKEWNLFYLAYFFGFHTNSMSFYPMIFQLLFQFGTMRVGVPNFEQISVYKRIYLRF